MKDYYAILEVALNASMEEIKQSYRQLAMKHHPDHGGLSEKFLELKEAYDVLSDANKRGQYNATLPRRPIRPKPITPKHDPNHGENTIHDVTPPMIDVFGQPLDGSTRRSKKKPWVDAYSRSYESLDMPDIR